MQRYFINDIEDKHHVVFTGEHYHHMVRVMRMKQGQQVYAVLPNEVTVIVEITEITDTVVYTKWVEDVDDDTELPVKISIALGVPKGDKLDWLVQKATELGVYTIYPFESDWAVVKWDTKKSKKKQERLQKIAQEAAEQSHRSHVPIVSDLLSFEQLLQLFTDFDDVLVAYEESAKSKENKHFKQVLQQLKPYQKVLVIFGAEGGLSPKEIERFVHHKATLCGLGPRIMRAETAPLYVLAACSYQLEL